MKAISLTSEEIAEPIPKIKRVKVAEVDFKSVRGKKQKDQAANTVRPKRRASHRHLTLPLLESDTMRSKTESSVNITDQLLLNAVRDQVYQKLIGGEISPGLGDCFKAIEIKHKISEESQNEKHLLEILNEIRAEELKKKK
jgi:hypothetical protein